ncbi:conserved oligomeric Golgi complex subunit 3 [Asbolus verrucosus]|uniref:Conserved oligomeric Golgi complex subunit 3 n=1 Tax=Asbolus verrucosus TaxID=1661398 RepID=A0A482VHV8_ASBVE|nr:conserved oligomeric Golgi complex subunit 3 [Asbolus verrucosus]
MNRFSNPNEDKVDIQIQQNITNWQSNTNPLAPLSDEQLDIIYQVGDLIKNESTDEKPEEIEDTKEEVDVMPKIDTNKAYIKWMISSENEIKHENLKKYQFYYQTLCDQSASCEKLFNCANETSDLLQELRNKYLQVTAKTDSLHNLNNIERYSNKISSQEYIELLNNIDDATEYLGEHLNFKESRIYKMKYESLLVTALNKVYKVVSNIILEATKQVLDPESKTNIVPLNSNTAESMDTAFSLYYGKFQSAASKVKLILSHLEEKCDKNEHDYLGVICQHLYDILRPSLITVNHVEVLSELCGILQKEMLNEKTISSDHLTKYVEVVKQLLEDVEERLVFRTNIFFQHDLMSYHPSPGDLAYPEKLEQMENIALELQEVRTDSRASAVSLESQEVANINSANPIPQFRSYTGNSPADLHGMWYPTVKRTLVILSRLYFCLDRETFQGLAQEALLICIHTVQHAANLISSRKSEIDGRLFQIKHLLIIREQIAPFQVDFTAEQFLESFTEGENLQKLPQQGFGKAKFVADIMSEALKNMKLKIPDIQRSMQLYLANRETEFILFRPIKNNVINVFVLVEQTLITAGYSSEELLQIACPSPEQINVLICSVSLTAEQEFTIAKQT